MIRCWGLGFQLNEFYKAILGLVDNMQQTFRVFNTGLLGLRLLNFIHQPIREFAQQEGVLSINQFIASAVAEKYPHWRRKTICKLGRNGQMAGILLRIGRSLIGDEL
jgi:hypothetical protein